MNELIEVLDHDLLDDLNEIPIETRETYLDYLSIQTEPNYD